MALAFAGFFAIFVVGFFARLILFRALLVFLAFLLTSLLARVFACFVHFAALLALFALLLASFIASLFARVLACFVHFAALLALLFAGVRTSLVAGLYIVC